METRRIGQLDVSVVGIGCNNFGWRIDAAATAKVVDAALAAGINFFDTADAYASGESEEFLRRALGNRRDEVVIATKFASRMGEHKEGAKPAYVRQAIEDSLRRLGTDHIDLYQQHKPDPATPIEDTLAVLEELKRAGKIREIGCSNFSGDQLRAAGGRFASIQNEYSLLKREAEADVLPECERSGIAFLPYFPLASGLLTGKYRLGQKSPAGSRGEAGWGPKVYTDANLALVEKLIAFAESRGHTILELAFGWLLAKRAIASVIAGATTADQVRANAASASWTLTEAEIAEVDAIGR